MKPVDIVILGIIGVVLVLVLLRIKKKGSCGCGCQNCRSACQKGKAADKTGLSEVGKKKP